MIGPEFQEFLDELAAESDRAAALLAGAYLDSRLELLLRSRLVSDEPMIRKLFESNGALSTFSSRISIAYGAGLIAQRTALDLHLVRAIRNDFAHKLHGLTFQADSMKSRVSEIRATQFAKEDGLFANDHPTATRRRFNVAVALLIFFEIEPRIDHTTRLTEQSPSPIPELAPAGYLPP